MRMQSMAILSGWVILGAALALPAAHAESGMNSNKRADKLSSKEPAYKSMNSNKPAAAGTNSAKPGLTGVNPNDLKVKPSTKSSAKEPAR